MYKNCNLCPRRCNVDRSRYNGYCKENNVMRISRSGLHMWEEPCISGENGSGAVFFTGCQLKCVFCQNYEIANNKNGREITEDELSNIFFKLKDKGANNINLVTADHFLPGVIKAIERSKNEGINLPFVYNCSGYITTESVRRLDGLIDIYLPDFKYYSPFVAMKYSRAKDYPKAAMQAIGEMVKQRGKCVFENGLLKNGVIVRHLVLPGNVADSKKVLNYLHKEYGDKIYISIMSQYTPVNADTIYNELKRKLYPEEYDEVVAFACEIGIENAYCQDVDAADKKFIPEFGVWEK